MIPLLLLGLGLALYYSAPKKGTQQPSDTRDASGQRVVSAVVPSEQGVLDYLVKTDALVAPSWYHAPNALTVLQEAAALKAANPSKYTALIQLLGSQDPKVLSMSSPDVIAMTAFLMGNNYPKMSAGYPRLSQIFSFRVGQMAPH